METVMILQTTTTIPGSGPVGEAPADPVYDSLHQTAAYGRDPDCGYQFWRDSFYTRETSSDAYPIMDGMELESFLGASEVDFGPSAHGSGAAFFWNMDGHADSNFGSSDSVHGSQGHYSFGSVRMKNEENSNQDDLDVFLSSSEMGNDARSIHLQHHHVHSATHHQQHYHPQSTVLGITSYGHVGVEPMAGTGANIGAKFPYDVKTEYHGPATKSGVSVPFTTSSSITINMSHSALKDAAPAKVAHEVDERPVRITRATARYFETGAHAASEKPDRKDVKVGRIKLVHEGKYEESGSTNARASGMVTRQKASSNVDMVTTTTTTVSVSRTSRASSGATRDGSVTKDPRERAYRASTTSQHMTMMTSHHVDGRNVCCHYCRRSMNRQRKRSTKYVHCSSCTKTFCRPCITNLMELDFDHLHKLALEGDWACSVCTGECCCCSLEMGCARDHRHCHTYTRTLKRHEKKKRMGQAKSANAALSQSLESDSAVPTTRGKQGRRANSDDEDYADHPSPPHKMARRSNSFSVGDDYGEEDIHTKSADSPVSFGVASSPYVSHLADDFGSMLVGVGLGASNPGVSLRNRSEGPNPMIAGL